MMTVRMKWQDGIIILNLQTYNEIITVLFTVKLRNTKDFKEIVTSIILFFNPVILFHHFFFLRGTRFSDF